MFAVKHSHLKSAAGTTRANTSKSVPAIDMPTINISMVWSTGQKNWHLRKPGAHREDESSRRQLCQCRIRRISRCTV